MIKIVVDLKGADKPQEELIYGVVKAINEISDLSVVVCCDSTITNLLASYEFAENRLEIIDSSEEITNYDNPLRAIKEKPNSSLVLGLNYSKENDDVKGFVSCGSTGAVLVSSILLLGKLNNVRPALASVLLQANGKRLCVMDCGANIDCKSSQLKDFAYMGIAYMKTLGIENPKVALLSNGSESKKGNELVKETYEIFKNLDINFVGNIEGKEALSGKTDVLVCDGFAGNVLLKTIEGTAMTVFDELVQMAKQLGTEGTSIINAVKKVSKKYDYNSQGGALLLGVNKVVVKGHGAATSETIYSIIKMAYELGKNNLIEKSKSILSE